MFATGVWYAVALLISKTIMDDSHTLCVDLSSKVNLATNFGGVVREESTETLAKQEDS